MDITHPDILRVEKTGEYQSERTGIRRCFGCGRMIQGDSEDRLYDGMGREFCSKGCRIRRLKTVLGGI